jgi:regulatory protein
MKQITKLVPTIKQGRINVYLDGAYSFTINNSLATHYQLEVGGYLEDDLLDKIKEEDRFHLFLNKVLDKLSLRPHSVDEIRRYCNKNLRKMKIVKPELDCEGWTERVLEELSKQGYLDDQRFCEWMVEVKSSKYSKQEIKNKLRLRGVPIKIINSLSSLNEIDDSDKLKSLIEKKGRQLVHKNYSEAVFKQKIFEYLLRKGYRYDEIRKVYQT